jgi:pyridoxamine 5'-phosphate oxidase
MSLDQRRIEYGKAALDDRSVDPDPVVQFQRWLLEAESAGVPEPNAMTLATATAGGLPSARIVLLRGVDRRGFVFFTDDRSNKGRELTDNPRAALVFFWQPIERQVRVTGAVSRIAEHDSDAYFGSRPRGSQIGAWSSEQSAVIAGREVLDRAVRTAEERYHGGPVPRPPYWGGFRVEPDQIEFWQGRPSRLHDRLRYSRVGDLWRIDRLSP